MRVEPLGPGFQSLNFHWALATFSVRGSSEMREYKVKTV